jgi:lipopolysaccharide transport system permease protein
MTEQTPPVAWASPNVSIAQRAREVWAVRGLLWEFVLRDVRVRYRQAVLGVLWALLMPTLSVLAGIVIRVLSSGGGLHSAAAHVAIAGVAVKAVGWAFFASSLGFATPSLASNAVLVGRVYFPREILPLSAVLAQATDLLAGLLSASVLLVLLRTSVGPTAAWALLLLPILFALTVGVCALLACANLFFRDVRYIVQVLLTFGIFFTPVFFDATQLGARAARLVMLNPVAPLLEGMRLAVVQGHDLLQPLVLANGAVAWQPWYLVYSAAWAMACLVGASVLYARLELAFAEYV